MTALKKLLDFADTLPNNKGIEFLQLLQAYQKEMIAEKTQLIEGYERIIRGTQNTPQYEVVAVAGTADMLLNEINVGDTVELNPNVELSKMDTEYLLKDGGNIKSLNTVTEKNKFSQITGIAVNNSNYMHRAELFRKVQTPLSNPLNTVEGC
jgi:hypothetical protein